MAFTQKSLQRISGSVSYTESVQRGSKAGGSKGWPRINQDQTIIKGMVVNNPITGGGSGEINVSINGVAQGEPYKTVWLDWLGSDGDDITVDRKVIAEWIADEDRWTITGADCGPVIQPAPPGHGDNIEALGTDRGTAAGLSFRVNRVDTIVAGVDDGVRLPATFEQGDDCFVQNNHATLTLNIYAATGDFIDGTDGATAATLPAGGSAHFFLVQSDEWVT